MHEHSQKKVLHTKIFVLKQVEHKINKATLYILRALHSISVRKGEGMGSNLGQDHLMIENMFKAFSVLGNLIYIAYFSCNNKELYYY